MEKQAKLERIIRVIELFLSGEKHGAMGKISPWFAPGPPAGQLGYPPKTVKRDGTSNRSPTIIEVKKAAVNGNFLRTAAAEQ